MSIPSLQKLLHTILLRSPTNLFDEFINECAKWYSQPAHTLTEMRTRDNKKIRGDIFEDFCVLYLKNIKKYQEVWRLEDVPDEILLLLALKRRDMGIDIIVKHNDSYFAVQCKYKKHSNTRKNSVSWKSLSTFYALCLRTGKEQNGKREWSKYIVMTNCDCARHEGVKTDKDLSICIGTFRKINLEEWTSMCDITGHFINEQTTNVSNINEPTEYINEIKQPINLKNPTKEELRLLRLAYYDKKTII
jgi:predicted helicase